MKKAFIFILTIFIISCSIHKNGTFSYTTSDNAWLQAFKDKAFEACLRESYKNDSIFALIEKQDLFNPYDGFYTHDEFIRKAENFGKDISKNIPPTNYKDYGKRNYFMASCLHYYASRELDSIAKAEYKKYTKIIDK